MLKILPLLILTFVFSFVLATSVHAATLSVKTIGGISVGTVVPTSWTHAGANPVMTGTASPSATVQLTINSTAYSTTANTLGDWTYTPAVLSSNGAHEVVVTSGTENLIFTLNLTGIGGATSSATTASTSTASSQPALPSALPSSGSSAAVLFALGGLFLLGLGAVTYAKLPSLIEDEL